MRTAGLVLVAIGCAVAASLVLIPARAGHELPIYPSYYPQEITFVPLDPAAAGRALDEGRVQAYVGRRPSFAAGARQTIRSVESLGAYLVVDVNPGSPRLGNGRAACAAAEAVVAALGQDDDFRFHPYPVNEFHADYLHHYDLAARAKGRFRAPEGAPPLDLAVLAEGPLAEKLVRRHRSATAADWDVRVEEIDLGRLVARQRSSVNGWLGPPWLKQGWFHAYLLLAEALADPAATTRAAALVDRLEKGAFDGEVERINLERDLVTLLTSGCGRTVAGYRPRHEFFSDDFSGGIENIAYDSHSGFNSAIFLRTVKLKDFPWNGWLALGVDGAPEAAWNPIAGFSDEAGRLIWWALGDPALFPEPYGADWTLNRIGDVKPAASE